MINPILLIVAIVACAFLVAASINTIIDLWGKPACRTWLIFPVISCLSWSVIGRFLIDMLLTHIRG